MHFKCRIPIFYSLARVQKISTKPSRTFANKGIQTIQIHRTQPIIESKPKEEKKPLADNPETQYPSLRPILDVHNHLQRIGMLSLGFLAGFSSAHTLWVTSMADEELIVRYAHSSRCISVAFYLLLLCATGSVFDRFDIGRIGVKCLMKCLTNAVSRSFCLQS